MKRLPSLIWPSLILLLAACSSSEPIPEDHYYRLMAMSPVNAQETPSIDGVLVVETPRSDGLRQGRSIVYSTEPSLIERKQYHYYMWEDRPARLIQDRLIEALDQRRLARILTTATSEINPSNLRDYYRLQMTLDEFDRHTHNGIRAKISLSARLIRVSDGRQMIFERHYEDTETASSDAMPDTARAMTAALDRILLQLMDDIRVAVESR